MLLSALSHAERKPHSSLRSSILLLILCWDSLYLKWVYELVLAHVNKHFSNIRCLSLYYKAFLWLDYTSTFSIYYRLSICIDSCPAEHRRKFWRYITGLEHFCKLQNLFVRKLLKAGRFLRHGRHASQSRTVV